MPVLSYLHQLFPGDTCHAYIHTLRWKDRPLQCPRCQSQDIDPWGNYPGEWPPSCQAASSRAAREAVSDTGGAGAVVTNCPRLSHCWASQLLQS